MPTISLLAKNKVLANYQISKGDSLLIGRNNVNDIVIDSLAISNQHAKIESDGNGYLYVDLQSSNGSFKKGRLIKSCWLNDGDTITVGIHNLRFSNPKIIEQPQKPQAVINKTVQIDPTKLREYLTQNKSKNNQKKKAKRTNIVKQRKTVAVLSYLSGNKKRVQLNNNLIKIGKNPKSDVIVKGFGIGKTAAVINKMTNAWYISYVGGFLKPRVNNTVLKKPIKLNNLDIIAIGLSKFQFLLE